MREFLKKRKQVCFCKAPSSSDRSAADTRDQTCIEEGSQVLGFDLYVTRLPGFHI